MTKVNTNKEILKKGRLDRLTSEIEVFPILDATNKQMPTGGVVNPIIRFNTAITEKWIGSMSTASATFNKIGNKTNNAAMVSINDPMKINNILIKKSTRYLLVDISKMPSATVCGSRSINKIHPKRFAKPIKTINEAEVFIESSITVEILDQFNFR